MKILTPSDANNGGGFSVPRFCADSIFPPLNYRAESSVQTLLFTDIHGMICLWVYELQRLVEKKAEFVSLVVEKKAKFVSLVVERE